MPKLYSKGHRAMRWLVTGHWLRTLSVMSISIIVFGILSSDIFFYFQENFHNIAAHGIMSLMDDNLTELITLLIQGFASLVLYIIFKACEKNLVERLLK